MAKVKFGMMMTDARGKLGGQVFSKNRAGAFVRTKVTPTNPRTLAQMVSRSILGSVSSAWSALTAEQRASFNSAVDEWKSTDIFGDLKTPSGKNLHSKLSKNKIQAGGVPLVAAPAKVEIPFLGQDAVIIEISAFEINFAIPTVPAGMTAQISSTGPLSAGTNFVDGKFRVLTYAPAGTILSDALYTDYVARFGVPAVGQNIHFQIRLIATASGQAGVPERVKATIIA